MKMKVHVHTCHKSIRCSKEKLLRGKTVGLENIWIIDKYLCVRYLQMKSTISSKTSKRIYLCLFVPLANNVQNKLNKSIHI